MAYSSLAAAAATASRSLWGASELLSRPLSPVVCALSIAKDQAHDQDAASLAPLASPASWWIRPRRRSAAADKHLTLEAMLCRAPEPRTAPHTRADGQTSKYYVARRAPQGQVFAIDRYEVRRLLADRALEWTRAVPAARMLAGELLVDLTSRQPPDHAVHELLFDVLLELPADGWVLPAEDLRLWLEVCGHVPRTWARNLPTRTRNS